MAESKKKSPYLSDIWSIEDALSFEAFKSPLLQILEQAETPLTVGVFATWGSGKTTLLHMLRSEIDSKNLTSIRSVWFTAWKYEKQEALWRAFILRVIDGLYPKDESGKRYSLADLGSERQQEGVRQLERLERSVYEAVNWQDEGKWSLDVGELTKQGVKLPIWLAFHLAGLGDAGKDLGLNPDLAAVLEREVREHHMNQLASMEQFEATFKEALTLILGEEGRLVVFVDDLDRCLPEKAIEVLEAIKLFLDVPGTVFVLGMDREVIRRGIESHYGALLREGYFAEKSEIPINGDLYLQKMIQLPFNLPPLDLRARTGFIEKLEETLPADFHLEEVTCQVFALGTFPNPRQVKRALNVFYLLKKIALEQEEHALIPKDVLAWPLLAKTVLIQSQWPELYQLWRQYPSLIQTLEDEYTRRPVLEDELLGGIQPVETPGDQELPRAGRSTRTQEQPKASGLIAPFINERQKYALLAELLRYPEETGEGRLRARFGGLTRTQMQMYVGLVGTVEQSAESATAGPVLPDSFIQELQSGDPARLREVLAVVREKETDPAGPQHQGLISQLIGVSRSSDLAPKNRAVAADMLDELGFLPEDLYQFLPLTRDQKPVLYAARYPVTNIQYERFLKSPDFGDKNLWVDFPKFDPKSQSMKETWGIGGWQWLQESLKGEKRSPDRKVVFPASWNDARFGIVRKSVPVVAVTWFEANAYCKWLLKHWRELEEGSANSHLLPMLVRLPTEMEWVELAGGDQPEDRYPWDGIGEATSDLKEILKRANTRESEINKTTPVGMYPLGSSQLGLQDLAGNVWEWQANYLDKKNFRLVLRGGSWGGDRVGARVSYRGQYLLDSDYGIGFRVVCLPS